MGKTATIKVTYHFYLHHLPTKTLIEKLSWTQMNAVCRTLRTAEWADYDCWVAEIDQWFPLPDMIPGILARSDGLFRKPPVPDKNLRGEILQHQLIDSPTDNREHSRYKVKIPLMVDVMGSLVNTFSEDISLSGIRLESTIPVRKEISHCFVYYRKDDDLIELKVKPFFETADSFSFQRVQIVSCNQLDLWEQLINRAKQSTAET